MKQPNMDALMKQAQQMQDKMQQEVGALRVEGTAGGGMVKIEMDGHKNVLAVKIDPEAAGDAEMLQDMVLAAFHDGAKSADAAAKKKMSGLMSGLGLPPGMF